ncbi:hypothetical protein AB0875_26495 [Micromonospora gifhornensis]|uniref:hypothetical protein n=1 Tax=Micromonospora gifhornensis TaxID=84594 RepID=UPI003453D4D1
MAAEVSRPSDVDVWSPDRSVRIVAGVDGQVRVQVQGLRRHTEDSLAGQVRAAVRLALARVQQPAERGGSRGSRSGW